MKRTGSHLCLISVVALFLCTGLAFGQDGTIVAWGSNSSGQCVVPAPNGDFQAISAGFEYGLGLKADGTIVAWGWNDYGECNVPAPNSGFEAVSGGFYHSLGLKSDGSIVAWGDNGYGECTVPAPNAEFQAISAGYFFSVGLKSDGTIVAWGRNNYGECNVPAPNSDFVAIDAGMSHILGLKSDGTIVAWGDNYQGQCNVPSPNADFEAVTGGRDHSMGLKSDGTIVAWGRNDSGQCNVPAPNADFVAIASGYLHSMGLKSDGSIVAWGNNSQGECDVPEPNGGFGAISALGFYSLALKGDTPVATFLSFMDAASEADGVNIQWRFNDFNKIQELNLLRQQDGAAPMVIASWSGIQARTVGSFVDQTAQPDVNYRYTLKVKQGGVEFVAGEIEISADAGVPGRTFSIANTPNPFNPSTTIAYSLSEPGQARLSVYDVSGRLVKTLLNTNLDAGPGTVTWNGTDQGGQRVASGTYFLRLATDQGIRSRKVLLAK